MPLALGATSVMLEQAQLQVRVEFYLFGWEKERNSTWYFIWILANEKQLLVLEIQAIFYFIYIYYFFFLIIKQNMHVSLVLVGVFLINRFFVLNFQMAGKQPI